MYFACVPNVSEGRDPERIAALVEAVAPRPGIDNPPDLALLDTSSDPDHHRTVLTLAGTESALLGALERLFAAAVERIDLRCHQGVHPRIGAVDVVPFTPLADAAMADAIQLAETLGARVAGRFDLPVLLYGRAARSAQRSELADIRRGGAAALAVRLAEHGADFGPRGLHPSAGATAIGARRPLVAFNVELRSGDLALARAVAARVRERGGGVPAVRALGLELARRGRVQVSMNLVDLERTRPIDAFERVRVEAAKRGAEIEASEIVGLVPRAALGVGDAERMRLGPVRTLEGCLERAGLLPVTSR